MSGTGAVNFTISAQDQASAKFDKIKKRVDGLTKTVDKTQKSFGALALQDLSGLTKRVENLGGGAGKVGEGLLKAVEPLAVITSAASLAGVVRLADTWADWGSKLLFTSQNLGMSAQKLQVWQNAGQLAGVSIDNMTSGLQDLRQNMWNAVGGRDPAFMAAMQMFKINFRQGATGIKDYSSLLPQIADKIKALHDPFAQAAIATELFGSAGTAMLPFLRQGAAGMTAYLNAGAANGTMTQDQIDKANQLRQSFTGLNQVLTGNGGLVNLIEAGLDPVLQPTIAWMQQWVVANQAWINLDIAKGVHNLGVEIKGIDWTGINSFMNLLTGKSQLSTMLNSLQAGAANAGADARTAFLDFWKYTGGGGAGAAPILKDAAGGIGWLFGKQITPAQASVRDQGMAYFESQGWSKAHAASIMGNVEGESGFDPGAINKTTGAAGLFQWLGSRATQFKNIFGVSPDQATPQQQFAFAQYELTHSETGAAAALHNSPNAGAGAIAFNNDFERNGIDMPGQSQRASFAQIINGLIPSGPPASVGGGSIMAGLGQHQGGQHRPADVALRQRGQHRERRWHGHAGAGSAPGGGGGYAARCPLPQLARGGEGLPKGRQLYREARHRKDREGNAGALVTVPTSTFRDIHRDRRHRGRHNQPSEPPAKRGGRRRQQQRTARSRNLNGRHHGL